MLRLGEAGKTEIMYSVNMSYFQLQKYLDFMLDRGLVDRVKLGNPSVTYRVTAKGLRLLRSIDVLALASLRLAAEKDLRLIDREVVRQALHQTPLG